MLAKEIEALCKNKQNELIQKYFGSLVHEAAVERPESIGIYTKDLPLKIEAEYKSFLEELWKDHAPEGYKGKPLMLEEQKLREMMTEDDREGVDNAYRNAMKKTWWERLTKSNHKDVTYYKGLLQEYTSDLLMVMRNDFLEEFTGQDIRNKTFEKQ